MTPREKVESELSKDFQKFYNSCYAGETNIPDNILELFKNGIKALPCYAHKILFLKVKLIASKNVNDLTYGDLNEVIKVLVNTPLYKLHTNVSFDEMVEERIAIDKFINNYNTIVDKFKEQLEMRRVTMLQLAGATNGSSKLIKA